MSMLSLHDLDEQTIRSMFANAADVNISSFLFETDTAPQKVVLLYCEGMAHSEKIDEFVLPRLHDMMATLDRVDSASINRHRMLQLVEIQDGPDMLETVTLDLYSGELLLLFEGPQLLYALDIANPPNRSTEESSSDVSLKGPRDALTESIVTNVALIRKRLKTQSLSYEKFIIGTRSHTNVALLYIHDIIRMEIVEEARQRLLALDVDSLLASEQLEEGLSDHPSSLLPLFEYIGRPDYVVDALLRGRFAIIVEGSPMAIIAPTNLTLLLKSPEDAHSPFYYVFFERLMRFMGLIVSIFLPGFWIAVAAFNLDQIPFPLLATIASVRLGLPFSGPMDFFLMLGLFELFREAGMRLPKAVGQTVTVVGGLIVGDAAIRSGITSPVTVVITSISTISMFTLVNQSLTGSISVLRIIILILSALFGMYGFMLALMGLALYLSSLESFGVPYLAPLSPINFKDIMTSLFGKPWTKRDRRPSFLHTQDPTRRGDGSR
ncbi:UNVERIFIED_CONTAM: hypothetical protein ABID98_002436 [Brevibacillus sp. OAP136]